MTKTPPTTDSVLRENPEVNDRISAFLASFVATNDIPKAEQQIDKIIQKHDQAKRQKLLKAMPKYVTSEMSDNMNDNPLRTDYFHLALTEVREAINKVYGVKK